ncbi:MAG: hypothetical protein JXA41_13360 [Deltaproteobacteria bacterium]|nr:hypothetical protein [Deltaproteobacteria bacterium]
MDITAIRKELEAIGDIKEINHLHVWNLSSESIAPAVHILMDDKMLSEVDAIAASMRDMLLHRFNIDHPVLQFETRHIEKDGLLCCPTNNYKG